MCRSALGSTVGFLMMLLLVGLVSIGWSEEGPGRDGVKTAGENGISEKFDADEYLNPPYLICLDDFMSVLENAMIGEYQISRRPYLDDTFGTQTVRFSLKRDDKVYSVWLRDYRSWNINLKSILRRPVSRPEKIPDFMKVKRTDTFYSIVHTSKSEVQYFDLKNRYWIWVMPKETYESALNEVDQIVQALVSLLGAKVSEAKGQDARKPK